MNPSTEKIEEIIGAKLDERNEEYGTPRGFETSLEGIFSGRGRGSTAKGDKGGKQKLKQLNLEESFRLEENRSGKRKERSPEEEEKKKKEKKEEAKREEERATESRKTDSEEEKEEKDKTEKEEGNMEKMQQTLDRMYKMMSEERKERREMMEEWEKKWEKKWKEMEEKINKELKELKDQLEEEREERIKMEERLRREAEKEGEKREELKKELEGKAKDIEERIKKGPSISEDGRNREERDYVENEGEIRQMKELEWRIEEGERVRKRNNVVWTGLEEEDWDKQKLEKWMKANLGVDVELRSVWRIRGKNKYKVGAECRDREEKEKLMEAKKKLKGTKIYIDHDTTWKERRARDKMIETAKEWRRKGHTVKMGRNRLMVDEKEYRWNEREGQFFRRDQE